ncbi:MAG TPA: glycosyltransferase [Patescibacteria group bacterium]|nr:glycosyltransferase [Patescibacteria group bacterium]
MKVALVHDYLREFGGAERVLKTLTEIFPKAPIYTAFKVTGSTADKEFKGKKVIQSFLAPIIKIDNLYSPLRFLAPVIWKSFDLSKYDLVITSSSWYITRGFKISSKTKVICYCHTPPRWLYGYETSVGLTKYWPVKVYAAIVGHIMRMYDFTSAQPIDLWIANSKNVQARIEKFYRKNSVVIYPPVDTIKIMNYESGIKGKKENYFLIVSRLVGAKGLEEAAKAFKNQSKYKLKIVGEAYGYSNVEKNLKQLSRGNIELMGRVDDKKLYELYTKAKGFIALAKDEDFGMTVVEAQAAGTPVIAFNGGGFRESVIDGVTGILINDTDEKTLKDVINRFEKIQWDKNKLQNQAKKFSKEQFISNIEEFVKIN